MRQIAISQLAVLLFVVAGIWVLILGDDGFAWFLPGVLLCYLVALSEAWVLLIEIKRETARKANGRAAVSLAAGRCHAQEAGSPHHPL